MILYKYVRLDGLDIIKSLRIKVSNPKDFNDPFEFIPSIIDVSSEQAETYFFDNENYLRRLHGFALSQGKTKEPYESYVKWLRSPTGHAEILRNIINMSDSLRVKCKELRNKSEKIALLTCFCGELIESHHEILMWSHYADSHKGLRIGFDKDLLCIQGTSFMEVNYEPNRIQLNPADYWIGGVEKLGSVFDEVIRTKSSIWSYEKEYRWMVDAKQCQREGENSFISINPKAIVEVIYGVNCPLDKVLPISNLVRNALGDCVKIKKAVIDNLEFKLNYVETV